MSRSAVTGPELAAGQWETVIGLETHVQLITQSKMFCGCPADAEAAEPNVNVCPVCLGLPGSLPVPNARAVELVIKAGRALDCRVAQVTHFDRKNYHYPDLPKGYQISQSEAPICADGSFAFADEHGNVTTIGIERVHLEEDTAKMAHVGDATLVDFNRAGVPLIEIVTRPELRSPDDAKSYLESLRRLLRWLGISTGNMEAGALRADVNVSVRPAGQTELGVKVEVKNLNSFAAAKAALEYEVERLTRRLSAGEAIAHETRGWSDAERRTFSQRSKEFAQDYRYFPEPDLPPLQVERAWVDEIDATMSELPLARRQRLVALGLTEEDARLITRDGATADYFESAVGVYQSDPARLAVWITGPLFGLMNAAGVDIASAAKRVSPASLAKLASVVDDGAITLSAGKPLLARMFETGEGPQAIIDAEGLGQISDPAALSDTVAKVVADNPQAVADYCGGKANAIGFLLGRAMRTTGGQANPNLVRELLENALATICEKRRSIES